MSAFLGPIHIKMYDRVLYQDTMSQNLLELAEEKGWADGLRVIADVKAPAASKAPLETIIDQSNIHSWLSAAVAGSERRFAIIVSGILSGRAERLGELENAMRDMGRQASLASQLDAERAFQAIHDILLDGMPCDFPFAITDSSADEVSWQVKSCPHAPYWDAEGCDADTYNLLRDAWIDGALEGRGLVHSRSGRGHALKRAR